MKKVKIEKFPTGNKDTETTEAKVAEYLNNEWIIEAMTFAPFDGLVIVFSKEE